MTSPQLEENTENMNQFQLMREDEESWQISEEVTVKVKE